MYLTFLFAVLVVIFDPAHSLDVECSSYTVLNSRDRAQGQHRGSVSKCDRNDITPGWYRFMGNAGTAMATSCVPTHHCGTNAPGWMNGSHPTQAEGVVTRRVCYSGYRNCCYFSNNIRVKNCERFYMYELVKPSACNLRYCGNVNNTVRIQGGGSSGRLQVLHNGVWGTVCDDGWSMTNTHVVCRQLGFAGALSHTNRDGGTGQIWLDDVQCSGSESAIQQCRHNGWGSHNCNHGEDVFVNCTTTGLTQCERNPCRNGGTCTEDIIQYYCTCPRGYNGSQCETSLTQCNSNPCRNGASCHGDQNHYYCNCYHGYTGRQCETSLRTRVTCEETYVQIDLKNSYFSDFDWRNLHLNDPSCRAVQDNTAHTVRLRAPLDGCGTTYTENQNTIIFWNEVRNDDRWKQPSRNASNIARGWDVALRFYCEYERKRLVSTSFKPARKTVVAFEGSYGNFTFKMDLYQTSRYRTSYSPLAYPVVVYPNQPLWVQYEVSNTNADLVVFAENCRATTSTNPDSFPQHLFLERGCILDSTMVYVHNPFSKVQRFSIRSFRFVHSNSHLVYLHCELLVCHQNSTNSRCAVGCTKPRGRRDSSDLKSSMPYDLSAGPLKGVSHNNNKGGETPLHTNTVLVAVLVTAGVFSVITLLLLMIIYRNRRRDKHNRASKMSNSITHDVSTLNSYEQENVEKDEYNERQN